jgi:transposase
MRPHGSPQELEQRRLKAVALLKKGLKPPEVAAKLGCVVSAVYRWKDEYGTQGAEALKAKPIPGRPTKLGTKQKQQLTDMLLKGAQSRGYSTELWTQKRIADLVSTRFRVQYHPRYIGQLLHEMGWSCQKPEKQARERDEAAIQQWKLGEWRHIKKRQKA